MKSASVLSPVAALALLSTGASAQNNEIEELKSMVREMQKTISAQNERIATLEKRQPTQKGKTATASAPSGRSVSVAGMNVPVAELPAGAMPKEKSAVRDADTFGDVQQAAPRPNNVPL